MTKQAYFSIFLFTLSLAFAVMSGFQMPADVPQPWLTTLEKQSGSNAGLSGIGHQNPEHAEQQPTYLTFTVQEKSAGVKAISSGGEVLAVRTLQYWRDPGIYRLLKSETEQQQPWEDLLVFVTDDNGNRIMQFLSRNHSAFREVSCDDLPGKVRNESFNYQR